MTRPKKLIIGGMSLFLLSIIGGLVGTVAGIHYSFDYLSANEAAGIGPVGSGIRWALISTILGVVGSAIGLLVIAVRVAKARRIP
ncbi:MAG: MotA/TolQ/ExbB proton channel family protein [Acidobacteria bacterium]|nr:MotA/TolQ/ExbB proton channel family protein [Acidobacteriota bacterium]